MTVSGPLIPGRADISGKGGSPLISGLLAALPLPEDRSTLALETLHFLKTGELHATLDEVNNLDAVAAVDAAYRSVKSGKLELC